jgi:hypothetical protein
VTENVIVVDERGNELGTTWPRRAKTLVKKGRACRIDENRICLIRPPNEQKLNSEDKMENNVAVGSEENVSLAEVLRQIDNIVVQAGKQNEAFDVIKCAIEQGYEEDCLENIVDGTVRIVHEREGTHYSALEVLKEILKVLQ